MDDTNQAEWISPAAALRLLASHGIQGRGEILDRLRADMIPARAERIVVERTDRYGGGKKTERADDATVPVWFWEKCAGPTNSVQDWGAGSFRGRGVLNGSRVFAQLFGVEFGADAVQRILPADLAAAATSHAPTLARPVKNKGGAKRSPKWDDFIAELAAYIHEEGMPEGEGTQGAEAVIDAVLARLQERGFDETLGRTTVQSAVNAVLVRLREK